VNSLAAFVALKKVWKKIMRRFGTQTIMVVSLGFPKIKGERP
jgi:hypothetical protein